MEVASFSDRYHLSWQGRAVHRRPAARRRRDARRAARRGQCIVRRETDGAPANTLLHVGLSASYALVDGPCATAAARSASSRRRYLIDTGYLDAENVPVTGLESKPAARRLDVGAVGGARVVRALEHRRRSGALRRLRRGEPLSHRRGVVRTSAPSASSARVEPLHDFRPCDGTGAFEVAARPPPPT